MKWDGWKGDPESWSGGLSAVQQVERLTAVIHGEIGSLQPQLTSKGAWDPYSYKRLILAILVQRDYTPYKYLACFLYIIQSSFHNPLHV